MTDLPAAPGDAAAFAGFYVRQGGRLSLNTEVLSIGASIGAGDPPVIALTSDDGSPNPVRWNGTTFVKR